jgi:hypothetical protein
MGFKYCKEGHIMDPSWKHCPVCLAPLRGWLVHIEENGSSGAVYTIHEGKSFIGSAAGSEIRIPDGKLARQHAYLAIHEVCTIVDMGNGPPLRVNNIETVKSTLIDGDLIQMGDVAFKIKLL